MKSEPSPKLINWGDHGLKVVGNNGSSAAIFGEICVPRQVFQRPVLLEKIKAAELRTRLMEGVINAV